MCSSRLTTKILLYYLAPPRFHADFSVMTITIKSPHWRDIATEGYFAVSLGMGVIVCVKTDSVNVRFVAGNRGSSLNEPCVQASCGTNHALLVSAKMRLYSIGSNRFGQCASSQEVSEVTEPSCIASGVRMAAAGPASSFFITEVGQLYAFGDNKYGQLGTSTHTETRSVWTPTNVNFTGPISSLSSGYSHTCLVSNGVLYGCGFNSHGQLDFICNRNEMLTQFTPAESLLSRSIRRVSCGVWCTAVVTIEGVMYVCGQAPAFQERPQGIREILSEHQRNRERRSLFEPRIGGFQRVPFDENFADVAVGSSIAIGLSSDRRTIWVIDLSELEVVEKFQPGDVVTHISVNGRYFSFSS